MYKIAICGKANSGKNTVSKFIVKELRRQPKDKPHLSCKYIAFADPIKAMIRLMFPSLPEKYLTGSSSYRSSIISNAFKNGQPLTVRQLLTDLGTEVGRSYNQTIWLDAFDNAFEKAKANDYDIVIVTDVRFRNEFDHLKKLGFYQIRLLRGEPELSVKTGHSSETEQDTIKDDEFDYILHNNSTLKDLKKEVTNIVNQFKS